MMRRRTTTSSRLTRTSEKQNRKQVIIFGIGIIILIFALIQFGPSVVTFFGNTIYSLRGDKGITTQIASKQIIQAPILSNIPSATQSAQITFSGNAPDTNGIIEIYVNEQLAKEVQIANSTGFTVDNLSLLNGSNTIKARFVKNSIKSAFTQDYQVNYTTQKPNLTITFPQDNASFTKSDNSITVSGTTDVENSVLVNGFRAIVDSNGNFTYLIQLNNGDNMITIQAQNPAGITTQKQLKVTYNP